MIPRDTIQALAAVTDEGLFELVATAVLREADPLCVGLSHPGVNAEGMTRKAPLDGIGFVRGANPPHLVAVHHTTTKIAGLKKKWLHDPAKVKRRKSSQGHVAPAGDVIKTAEFVVKERIRTPNLLATLILTTNEEPGDQLVLDVKAAGAAQNIEVDVWSRSRIAHILDNHPTGQWIRRELLGIEQQRLSKELLAELSRRSLELTPLHDDPRAWVTRAADRTIARPRRLATFLVAESGRGKSVVCHRALRTHVEAGGYGLVLPHEFVDRSITFDQAVTDTVRQLHQALAPGQSPLGFCSPDHPLLVIVEDINRSVQPQRLVEKLASWAMKPGEGKAVSTGPWRLICPIWPHVLGSIEEQARRVLEPMITFLEPLTPEEGRNSVISRVALAGHFMSEATAEKISSALGHDPLLIALHEFNVAPDPDRVLERFIESALMGAQAATGEVTTDLRAALMNLAAQMLFRRRLELSWREVTNWDLPQCVLDRLKQLALGERLLRLSGPSTDLRLSFRHDRVREWLLIEAAAEMDSKGALADELIGEPFFAEIVGAVAVRRGAPAALLDRLRRFNPLALFHALRRAPAGGTTERDRIVQTIVDWLAEPANRGAAHASLRWEALATLEETDDAEVPRIVRLFPDNIPHGQLARLRNGDLRGGIEACVNLELGLRAPLRDRQIAHAKLHFGTRLVREIDETLRRPDLPPVARSGLLHLAGHFADTSLAASVSECWHADKSRVDRLPEYLWAFARCCNDLTAASYLDPVCAAWAALPNIPEKTGHPSPRNELAADAVKWAFEQALPINALNYFVARARQEDLAWPITYMLHGVDHPVAVAFIAEAVAESLRRSDDGPAVFLSTVTDHWRRVQDGGRMMSSVSRNLLLRLWQDAGNDRPMRVGAFAIWAATQEHDDVAILRSAEEDVDLRDQILAMRLARGDNHAIRGLLHELRNREHGSRWWFYARHVWCAELTAALDEALTWRGCQASRTWNDNFHQDGNTSEMIIRLPVAEAERLLLKHWGHLRFSSRFVQAALYVTTPELCRLAAISVSETPAPAKIFASLSHTYGIRIYGHPGVTREAQVLALEPFLHLIDDRNVASLAIACNEAGWFDIRRRLLDARLTSRYNRLIPKVDAEVFDELATENRIFLTGHRIDEALKTGVTWREYLDALEAWLDERKTMGALRLVARALMHKGSRADLRVLRVYPGINSVAAAALITSTSFTVRRRTLE
jgi:hypothetical protein